MMRMYDLVAQVLRLFIYRSRGRAYSLSLLFILLTNVGVWGQSDSLASSVGYLPIEWLVESLPSDEISELEEDDLLELDLLSRDKIDLNRATQEEIRERFPFLSSYQIYQLRRYRDERGGELQSIYDLKWIMGWDRETIARVAPYVIVRPFAQEDYDKPLRPLRGETYLAMSYGNPTKEQKGPWYDPLKLRSVISLRQKNSWRAAVQYQRYPHEPIPLGSWRYYVEYEPRISYVNKIILGYFKVGWGAGLLVSRSIWASASAMPKLSRRRAVVSSSLSAMRENSLRGVAIEGRWGVWSYSTFYSYSLLDGSIDERQGLIEAIRPNIRYDTPEQQAQHATIPMQTVGGQFAYSRQRTSLSLQTLYADWMGYDLVFMPGYKALQRDTPLQAHWLTSLDYKWQSKSRRIELHGEVATEHLQSVGVIQHILYYTPRQRTLGATLYYMSPRFNSYYGRSESHYGRLGNDMGVRLYGTTRLRGATTVRAILELYQSIEPRYRHTERSRGALTRLYLTTRYSSHIEHLWYGYIARSNEESFRWRLSSTLRYNLSPLSLQLVGTLQERQLRNQEDAQWGRSLTFVGRYRWGERHPLSIALSGHYYYADHQRVASYAYLPTSRYSFGLYSAVGQGVATAFHLQWQLARHWTLSAGIRYDCNLDEDFTRWRADSYLSYRF